ncbi:hypothetical protein BJV82DRAFT_595418 [Fennellomyces sp. T-0311]|nr:hypothetical protein BJV82DRAFT_595418 [Fennellomyces sp. T-0311]
MTSLSANTKRLYIGNFDSTVDEYAIIKLFEAYGKITFLDYMFHWNGPKKGQPRGYCFLEYEKKEEALNAISALHRKVIKGRPLVVSFAYMNEQDDRRGQTSSGANRPNAFTILRTQRMANASTDAKIQAIERKLATLQSRSTLPSATLKSSPSLSSASSSHYQSKSIRSALSTEATHHHTNMKSTKESSSPSTSSPARRYKPY